MWLQISPHHPQELDFVPHTRKGAYNDVLERRFIIRDRYLLSDPKSLRKSLTDLVGQPLPLPPQQTNDT